MLIPLVLLWLTIRELAETLCHVIEFDGKLVFDTTKPDGTPRKLLDVSRLCALGCTAEIGLTAGAMASLFAQLFNFQP